VGPIKSVFELLKFMKLNQNLLLNSPSDSLLLFLQLSLYLIRNYLCYSVTIHPKEHTNYIELIYVLYYCNLEFKYDEKLYV
jgi:hypothetical protein